MFDAPTARAVAQKGFGDVGEASLPREAKAAVSPAAAAPASPPREGLGPVAGGARKFFEQSAQRPTKQGRVALDFHGFYALIEEAAGKASSRAGPWWAKLDEPYGVVHVISPHAGG